MKFGWTALRDAARSTPKIPTAGNEDRETLRDERDGYKRAYETLAEEIGAQRALLIEYRKLYAALVDATRPEAHAAPHQTSPRHFLILANGRTGSTWLESSLNQLPDVRAHRQIGWRLGPQPDHGARFSINAADSMKAIIDAACDTKEPLPLAVAGSKFVYQPYTYTHGSIARQLSGCIEPDIRLLLLKRSYLGCFLSWKTRGVAHSIDPQVAARQRANVTSIGHRADAEPRHIVLTVGGAPLADAPGNPYPLKLAVDDILVMFTNDLLSREIVGERSGLMVDYKDVAARFVEIARFIGSTAPDEVIRDAIARPLTRKLADLADFLHPIEPFAAIAECLDRAFWAGAGGEAIEQPDGSLRLNVPGLKQALAAAGAPVESDGEAVIWWPRKPAMMI